MQFSTGQFKKALGSSASAISAISGSVTDVNGEVPNAFLRALRKLQKERLVMARLGCFEKAFELDQAIQVMRQKAAQEKKNEEKRALLDNIHKIKIN